MYVGVVRTIFRKTGGIFCRWPHRTAGLDQTLDGVDSLKGTKTKEFSADGSAHRRTSHRCFIHPEA